MRQLIEFILFVSLLSWRYKLFLFLEFGKLSYEFIIKHSQPSFDKVIPPSFLELGFSSLVSIYSELCELGNPPPIIDANHLQADPEVRDCCNN